MDPLTGTEVAMMFGSLTMTMGGLNVMFGMVLRALPEQRPAKRARVSGRRLP